MSWARVDDGWWCHPKVMGLPLSSVGLWVTVLSWSCKQQQNVLTLDALEEIVGDRTWGDRTDLHLDVANLCAVGLWAHNGGGVYRIEEWDDMVVVKRRRLAIPAWKRCAVYERDGGACLECGTTVDLTLDHIHPFSKGGSDEMDNLRTLCRPCNSRKGAKV